MSDLPAQLNPIILPLMASIRREQEEILQDKAVDALAELISFCVMWKPDPRCRHVIEMYFGEKFRWFPDVEYEEGWIERIRAVDPDCLYLEVWGRIVLEVGLGFCCLRVLVVCFLLFIGVGSMDDVSPKGPDLVLVSKQSAERAGFVLLWWCVVGSVGVGCVSWVGSRD
ncbi:hypothetical protein Droror1_Dr00020053 [Drosera rotundifolia]